MDVPGHNQLNGSFRRIISTIISLAARKDIAAAWYVLIKTQESKVLLTTRGGKSGDPLLCPPPTSSSLSFAVYTDFFFPSTLPSFSRGLSLFFPRTIVLFVLHLSPFADELFTTRSRAQVREVLGSIPGSAGGSSYHDGHLATGTSLTISHHTSLHRACILLHPTMRSHPRTMPPWSPMGISATISPCTLAYCSRDMLV